MEVSEKLAKLLINKGEKNESNISICKYKPNYSGNCIFF